MSYSIECTGSRKFPLSWRKGKGGIAGARYKHKGIETYEEAVQITKECEQIALREGSHMYYRAVEEE